MYRLNLTQSRYYRLDPDLAEPTKRLQAFPQNFRMIVGNPFKRAFVGPEDSALVPQSLWAGYETKQPFLEQMALGKWKAVGGT